MLVALFIAVLIGSIDLMLYYVGVMMGVSYLYLLLFGGWLDMAIISGFWFIYEALMTPRSSKTLRTAKMKKKIPLFIEYDNGLLEIKLEKESTPEGGILAEDGWIGFVPRASISENLEEVEALEGIAPLVTRSSYMPDIGMTARVGYAGKGILTNVKTVAELEHGSVEMVGNPVPKQIIHVGKSAREVTVFWPISIKTLKTFFPRSWNIATIRALEKRAMNIGFEKGRRSQRNEKLMIWFLIAAGVFVGALGLVMYFLR